MGRGVNKVIIVGNLGQDPEVRYMPNGNAVAKISVATSDTWKDKNTGQQQEKTEWHRIILFGKLAEVAGEYLRKGSQVYIEGKLQTRKWQNQQGQDQYTTEIIVDGFDGKMKMLGGGNGNQGQQQGYHQGNNQPQAQGQNVANGTQNANQHQQSNYSQSRNNQQGSASNPMEPPIDFDDDIPFSPIGLQYPALLIAS